MASQSAPGPGRAAAHWLWFMVGAAIVTQTALNLVRPVTSYQLLELGADGRMIGLVTAAYALLPLIAVMWLGRLAERLARLSLLIVIGGVGMALACALLGAADSVAMVVAATILLGSTHLVFTIAGQAAVARYSPPEALDRGFGWFTAAFAFGQLAGPLLGGMLLGQDSVAGERLEHIAWIMWLGGGIALLTLPLMIPLLLAPTSGTGRRSRAAGKAQITAGIAAQDTGAGRPTMRGILRRPGVPSHMAASLALLSMNDLLIAFMPLLGEERGVAPFWIGLLLAVRAGASIVSRVLLPWLSDRIERPVLVIISLFGAAATIVLTPATLSSIVLTAMLMTVGGFCLGLGQPLTMTLVTKDVPAGWRSSALAVRLMGNRVGQVVVPLAAGTIAAPFGPSGAIWFASGLLAVCGVEKLARQLRGRG